MLRKAFVQIIVIERKKYRVLISREREKRRKLTFENDQKKYN